MAKDWTIGGIGVWIILSPWILGFAHFSLAKWNNVVLGLILTLTAVWSLFGEKPTNSTASDKTSSKL